MAKPLNRYPLDDGPRLLGEGIYKLISCVMHVLKNVNFGFILERTLKLCTIYYLTTKLKYYLGFLTPKLELEAYTEEQQEAKDLMRPIIAIVSASFTPSLAGFISLCIHKRSRVLPLGS